MKKILFAVVFAIGVLIPVVMADVSTETLTFVSFYNGALPVSGDGDIDYTISCYGYTAWPDDEWFGEELEEGSYTPEVVYSYSASCGGPEEVCMTEEPYYMNYRHIDYCDIEGTIDGESFSISNFDDHPYDYCYDVTDENRSSYDEYTSQDYLERICYEKVDISSEGGDYFSDIDGSPYWSAIRYLKSEGIVEGYEDGTYKPDNTINRAEFLKIIMSSHVHSDEDYTCDWGNGTFFSDITDDTWYSSYICKAVHYGIVSGYPDGSFKPEQKVNFAEAAKIIVNSYGYDLPVLYDDLDVEWYEPYGYVLQEKNAIPLSIGDVDHFVTRGEMAEMIYRLQTNYSSEYDAAQCMFINGDETCNL